jgi:hypothetical protein
VSVGHKTDIIIIIIIILALDSVLQVWIQYILYGTTQRVRHQTTDMTKVYNVILKILFFNCRECYILYFTLF